MKEAHEQRKTKIDIDELKSGTTNITLSTPPKSTAPVSILHKMGH